MLAWFARVSRFGVFVLGLVLLAWLPVSFFLTAGVDWRALGSIIRIYSWDGHAAASRLEPDSLFSDWSLFNISISRRNGLDPVSEGLALWPSYNDYSLTNPYASYRQRIVTLPLWLLCAFCLAWPVASFHVQRRRRRRGFPVDGAEKE